MMLLSYKPTSRILTLTLGITFVLIGSVSKGDTSLLQNEWKISLGYQSSKTEDSSKDFTSSVLAFNSKIEISPIASLYFSPRVRFQSGSYSNVNSQNTAPSSLALLEGKLQLADSFWKMEMGQLNPTVLHPFYFFAENGQPGLNGSLGSDALNFNAFGSVLPSVTSPTSNNDSNTSAFASARLNSNFQNKNFQFKNSIGYFKYDHLNTAIATDSSLLGNSTSSINESENKFNYGYFGPFFMSDLSWNFTSRYTPHLIFEISNNNSSPSGMGQGLFAILKNEYNLSSKKQIEFNASYSRIEPDAVVASYSNYKTSFTNKVGYELSTFLNLKKENIRFGMAAGQNQLIYINPAQSAEVYFILKVETFYAKI